MRTEEIAKRLVSLCREQKWEAAQKELFAPNAISIEPQPRPGVDKETRGLPAIIQKGHEFTARVQTMHSVSISEPLVASNAIACTMSMDVTFKGEPRMQVSEVCVYQVKDGKIISEQFYV